jgi:hypothetical protein
MLTSVIAVLLPDDLEKIKREGIATKITVSTRKCTNTMKSEIKSVHSHNSLVRSNIQGAEKVLAATFLVITWVYFKLISSKFYQA